MSNKELWGKVFTTDPAAVKPITGKQYAGNSPKPYWIIERATDTFGPCGIGWGLIINNERFERLSDTDVLHVANVTVWYIYDGKRGELQQMGQTKAAYKTSKGLIFVDEDAPKKSVTDALVKCLSMIGFAGDIFSGRWDDSKYIESAAAAYAPKQKAGSAMDASREAFDAMNSEEQEFLIGLAKDVTVLMGEDQSGYKKAYEKIEGEHLDNDEKLAMWHLLDSKSRSAIKKASNESKQQGEQQ